MYTIILFINTVGPTKHKLFVPQYHRMFSTFEKSTVGCGQVLEELGLDAELNILQAYDRAVGRGKQNKQTSSAVDATAAAAGNGIYIS